jgi:hypothetical protein
MVANGLLLFLNKLKIMLQLQAQRSQDSMAQRLKFPEHLRVHLLTTQEEASYML